MTRTEQNYQILERLGDLVEVQTGLTDKIDTIRRAAITLRTWYEHECNGVIQRDENNIPYRHYGKYMENKYRTPDREKGAIKRISEICSELNLHYYLQTDPRGGTLYVSDQPLNSMNYTNGIFIA